MTTSSEGARTALAVLMAGEVEDYGGLIALLEELEPVEMANVIITLSGLLAGTIQSSGRTVSEYVAERREWADSLTDELGH